MASANKISCATAGSLSKADFLKSFVFPKTFMATPRPRGARVYANQQTIWNQIAADPRDANKRANFVNEKDEDPTVEGRIFGSIVKREEGLADGVIMIGYTLTCSVATCSTDPLSRRSRSPTVAGTLPLTVTCSMTVALPSRRASFSSPSAPPQQPRLRRCRMAEKPSCLTLSREALRIPAECYDFDAEIEDYRSRPRDARAGGVAAS